MIDKLLFREYSASNFTIVRKEQKSIILLKLTANNNIEAENQAQALLSDICAFLTVETNVNCSYDDFSVEEGDLPRTQNDNIFVDDYLELHPHFETEEICISSYALRFIDGIILGGVRFSPRPVGYKHFIASCNHFQIGRQTEMLNGDIVAAVFPSNMLKLAPINNKAIERNNTMALMSYLSSVECATAHSSNPETCEACGSPKYKISARVRDTAAKYLKPHFNEIYRDLYGVRSKFLHEGRFVSSSFGTITFPLLNEDNKSGLTERGTLSGLGFSIDNVREWTSRILRCMYQETFFNRTEFEEVFYEPDTSLPLKIKVFPESGIKIGFVSETGDSPTPQIPIPQPHSEE